MWHLYLMLYHYTTGQCIDAITEDGYIRPTTSWTETNERPVVWLTISQNWEETANKNWVGEIDGKQQRVVLDRAATHELAGGLARVMISAEARVHKWREFQLLSKCPPKIVRQLGLIGMEKGSKPADWRFTTEAIPAALWERIEFWNSGSWQLDRPKIETSDARKQALLKERART